jgi:hypothetical protein
VATGRSRWRPASASNPNGNSRRHAAWRLELTQSVTLPLVFVTSVVELLAHHIERVGSFFTFEGP